MFASFAKNLFGSSNDRIVKSMQPLVQQINDREANLASLGDDAIRAIIVDIRQKITDGASKDDFLIKNSISHPSGFTINPLLSEEITVTVISPLFEFAVIVVGTTTETKNCPELTASTVKVPVLAIGDHILGP